MPSSRAVLLLAALLAAAVLSWGDPGIGAGRTVAFTLLVDLPASTPDGATVLLELRGGNAGPDLLPLVSDGPRRARLALEWPEDEVLSFCIRREGPGTGETARDGGPVPPRRLRPHPGTTFRLRVESWADRPFTSVVGRVEILRDPSFLDGRRCWVWLPDAYDGSDRRYPVLYMHDGQNLFDQAAADAAEWRLDETLAAGIAAGSLPPVIVVGIENDGGRRLHEYTPWPDGAWTGGGAAAYLDAVAKRLKPLVDRRYRTLAAPGHTYTAGSSLGGLLAAWAAWTRPEVFAGGVAAVSPSYWWADGAILDLARRKGAPRVGRFYQDTGTLESGTPRDRDGDGTEDSVQRLRAMEALLVDAGRRPGTDLLTVVGAGDGHCEEAWARRLPAMLSFLLAAEAP